jgi:hypothetical protein
MDLNNTEQNLFEEISSLIEQTRRTVFQYASNTTITLFWNIGQRINHEVLRNKRADYGKQIVSQLATQLTTKYGRSFEMRNLRRMMQFSEQFPDFEIVSQVATQLSWSHIIEVLPLKTNQAQLYYLEEAVRGNIGRNGLRELISRKAYERKEIANIQIGDLSKVPVDTFKDPFF